VTVRVPATTANLGPGFDCIGLALDLWNEVTVELGQFKVTVLGDGAGELPEDSRNLAVTGAEAAFAAAGKPLLPLKYTLRNAIPHGRGLGSSSAAIAGGLIAGAALAGLQPDLKQILKLAADIEGHPDNVAPAIYGGCCIGVHDGEEWVVSSVPLPEGLHAVVYVPDLQKSTSEMRARLTPQVSRPDAIYNIGRAALLVNALATGRLELLHQATQDRLHQPARGQVFKAMNTIIKAALNGGAHGAFLSGAGPAVLALTTGREVTVNYEMCEAARLHGLAGKGMILKPSFKGAYVVS
jgi:homoserine kinase